MKKIIRLTESDLTRIIKETIEFRRKNKGSKDILKTFKDEKHYKWFDYLDPNVKNQFDPQFVDIHIERALKTSLSYLTEMYKYNLKRVIAKENGQTVGFLIYTDESDKSIDDLGDGKKYPVLLSAAVHPDFRNKGVLRSLIEKSNVSKPFLVHSGPLSPPGLWEKFGCRFAKEYMDSNQILKCE